MISIIVAVSLENAIGKQGGLLCHLPNDLQHFKQITTGKPVVMGERTFFSLPRHPLPNRRNIVLTDVPGKTFDGAEVAYSIPEVQNMVKDEPEVFIIGGGMVYRQFMPLANKLYITHMKHSWQDADTFFPEIDPGVWKKISSESHDADDKNPYPYEFAEYIKQTK
ncbi:MAG: dihydrofolate reductase [Paludibacteraceae bacterium]|nr:dihydrofolate reductase [Paludibacteraceae bacterium]